MLRSALAAVEARELGKGVLELGERLRSALCCLEAAAEMLHSRAMRITRARRRRAAVGKLLCAMCGCGSALNGVK